MKLHLIRTLSIVLALTSLALTGCAKKSFDHVETTVPVTETPVPWSNSGEFTYNPGEDSINTVLNWAQAPEMQVYGESLYLYGHWRPMRYDLATGRQTDICTDPLCTHERKSDCPFNSVASTGERYYVIDDKVLFYKQSPVRSDNRMYMEYSLYLYSTTDRTTKLLRRFEDWGDELVPLSDAFFFIDHVYNEEDDTYTFSLCRQAYNSDKPEVLRTEVQKHFQLYGTNGEGIYVYDAASGAMLTLSLDGKTELARVEMDRWATPAVSKDGYLIYMEEGELFRVNLDGSDRRSLGIADAKYFYLTDSYIYYQKVDGEKWYHDLHDLDNLQDDESFKIEFESIYRVDHEGKNQERVYQTTAEDTVMVAPKEFIVLGNYLYAPFTYYTIDGDKATIQGSNNVLGDTESYSYCRIDLSTGEVYFIDTPL